MDGQSRTVMVATHPPRVVELEPEWKYIVKTFDVVVNVGVCPLAILVYDPLT